jgi:uncharacterized membrane protein (DUF373 family)
MLRKLLTTRTSIHIVLCLQIVPLLVFPFSSFTLKSQEWWLPGLLTVFVLIGLFQLLIRKAEVAWPWYLLSFAQGMSIISRLMMLMPHATKYVDKVQRFNTDYVVIAAASMLFSAFEIWYMDLPEVHNELLNDRDGRAAA